ncbi:hypothetical protein F2Q70_00001644 [Brassica cretica]|uniref:Uncharacterized protein n=1 Tax=Brassica cretica TaxID=69181 RepID=A0A8S9INP7_BRACR|nr:hypothetical protein F2Q70_00001644 [Brassica cretica]
MSSVKLCWFELVAILHHEICRQFDASPCSAHLISAKSRPSSRTRSDLEISDDFGAFWRYLEQSPEMTIELDHRSILKRNNRSMFTCLHRSKAKRAESPLGHIRLEAQVFTNLQDCP